MSHPSEQKARRDLRAASDGSGDVHLVTVEVNETWHARTTSWVTLKTKNDGSRPSVIHRGPTLGDVNRYARTTANMHRGFKLRLAREPGRVVCPGCRGTGWHRDDECNDCSGVGTLPSQVRS